MMIMDTELRTYSELCERESFDDRFLYLMLNGKVGKETFGIDRYINQRFYKEDKLWLRCRDEIIMRDKGCDLGLKDYEIEGPIIIHHMNPILLSDIVLRTDILLNPDFLICVSASTHRAIHYHINITSPEVAILNSMAERTPFDTSPWRKGGIQ